MQKHRRGPECQEIRLEKGVGAFGKLLVISGRQFHHLQNGINGDYLLLELNEIVMCV